MTEPDSLRMVPANVPAEACALGSMLLDNTTIDDVADLLRPDDFFRDSHRLLCRRIFDLHGSGNPVDALTLVEELERRGEFGEVGGDEAIRALLEAPPHAANAAFYAAIVHQKAVARRLIEQAHATLRECYSNTFAADELLAQAEARLYAIGADRAAGETSDIAAALDEALALLERRAAGEVTGVASGWRELDDLLGGFQPGTLTVVGGRPSMGKSAFALNIADHAATSGGVACLLVSLEMSRREIAARMIASRSGVDGYLIRNAHAMTDGHRARVFEAAATLRAAPLLVHDLPAGTAARIASNARRQRARRGVGLVIVDYLQLVDGEGQNRQEQVASISRRLKSLAKELDVPVLALSQINRAVEAREDHVPRMADLRESGAIEQDADVVVLLHRPDYYDPEDEPGVAWAIVAKNRNGATGTVRLCFRREVARFFSLYPEGA